jgi:hypothetical protein
MKTKAIWTVCLLIALAAPCVTAASVVVPPSVPTSIVPVLVDGLGGMSSVEVTVGGKHQTAPVGNASKLTFNIGPLAEGTATWGVNVYGAGVVQRFNGSVFVQDTTGPLLARLDALAAEVDSLVVVVAALNASAAKSLDSGGLLAALNASVAAIVLDAAAAKHEAALAHEVALNVSKLLAPLAAAIDALKSGAASKQEVVAVQAKLEDLVPRAEFQAWRQEHDASTAEGYADLASAQEGTGRKVAAINGVGTGVVVVAGLGFAAVLSMLWFLLRLQQHNRKMAAMLLAMGRELGLDPEGEDFQAAQRDVGLLPGQSGQYRGQPAQLTLSNGVPVVEAAGSDEDELAQLLGIDGAVDEEFED